MADYTTPKPTGRTCLLPGCGKEVLASNTREKRTKRFCNRSCAAKMPRSGRPAKRTRESATRELVIKRYSNGTMACLICGFNDLRALQLDHVNNDGAEHRREIGGHRRTWRWIVKNRYPAGFQVLCANCHCIKTQDGDEALELDDE